MAFRDQICFTNEANCTLFKGHMLKANMCTNCFKDISKHNQNTVGEADLIKALEHTQKGEKTPSLIVEDKGAKLYLGGFKAALNEEFIQRENIVAIVNTVGTGLFKLFGRKFEESYKAVLATNNISCLSFEWEDATSYNISNDDFEQAIRYIHEHRMSGGSVLVHCAQGKSRSSTLVVAYLMTVFNYDHQQALKYTQERRKMAEPNPHFMYQLFEYEKSELIKNLRKDFL